MGWVDRGQFRHSYWPLILASARTAGRRSPGPAAGGRASAALVPWPRPLAPQRPARFTGATLLGFLARDSVRILSCAGGRAGMRAERAGRGVVRAGRGRAGFGWSWQASVGRKAAGTFVPAGGRLPPP